MNKFFKSSHNGYGFYSSIGVPFQFSRLFYRKEKKISAKMAIICKNKWHFGTTTYWTCARV